VSLSLLTLRVLQRGWRGAGACGRGGRRARWPAAFVESLRFEKTSKIIKSNRQHNTTVAAQPCPEVQHLHIFWRPPGMVTPPLPWAAWSNVWPLFQ